MPSTYLEPRPVLLCRSRTTPQPGLCRPQDYGQEQYQHIPADAKQLAIQNGDIIEIRNDYGSVYGVAYLCADVKQGQAFMMFGSPFGVMGNVTTSATDENVVPYYKGAWADIRRVGPQADYRATMSFKSRRYDAGNGAA